jgi:uncharacterized protein (TIGR03067 family)
MRWQMFAVALATSACFGVSEQGAGKGDEDVLQGTWQVVGGEMQGMALKEEMMKDLDVRMTVKGNTFEFKTKGADDETGTYKLDPSKTPRHIDIVTNKGQNRKGIYELKGDEFKVCLDPEGKTRPTEFKSKAESPIGVMVFKRVQK